MAFLFRHSPGAIDEIERRFEVGKRKTPSDMMFFYDLPVRKLSGEGQELVAFERRSSTSAGYAMLVGQFRHGVATHTWSSLIMTQGARCLMSLGLLWSPSPGKSARLRYGGKLRWEPALAAFSTGTYGACLTKDKQNS
jgi:hypothetical protein